MDVLALHAAYHLRLLTETPGLKLLLLDAHSTTLIAHTTPHSTLLANDVYLVEKIENKRENLKHLKCIAYLRPDEETITRMCQELRNPNYAEYAIYFSSLIQKSLLERLAESDDHEKVKSVAEFFSDYVPITPELYTPIKDPLEGLLSICLALKKRPVIRAQRGSKAAARLGGDLAYAISQEPALFDFKKPDIAPLLLIADRRTDVITPLLSQWTYQAMVHELLTIRNGRVNIPGSTEIVLSHPTDPFFASSYILNFGDLGTSIKGLVQNYQSQHPSTKSKLETIADMKKFVEAYPEFRKLSGHVSKHVSLVSELSRRTEQHDLLECSEWEQECWKSGIWADDLAGLTKLMQKNNVEKQHKLRLLLIFAAKHHANPSFNSTLSTLGRENDFALEELSLVPMLIKCMLTQPVKMEGTADLLRTQWKKAREGVKGVENVYTQHVPELSTILEDAIKGKLRDSSWPLAENSSGLTPGVGGVKPRDIIIYMVGGATYEECRIVKQLNTNVPTIGATGGNAGINVILGGDVILNSKMFLDRLRSGDYSDVFEMTSGDHNSVSESVTSPYASLAPSFAKRKPGDLVGF